MHFLLTSLISAIMMGAGDFFGGVAAKRSPVALVGLIGQGIGFFVALAIILIGAHSFAYTPFVLGLGAGFCGSFALLSLYRGLAIGRVTIVAPLSAVLGALIPVVVSLATGHHFAPAKWAGIVAGLVSIYFLSLPSQSERAEQKTTGIPHAIVAGTCLALFYMLLGNEETHGNIWTLFGERISVVSVMILALLIRRQAITKRIPALGTIIIAGCCDILSNLAFLYSATIGPLPIVALITSMYPATTLFLGWVILKEHMSRRLLIGIACAFVCLVTFALP